MIRLVKESDCDELGQFFNQNDLAEITRHFHPFPLTDQTAHRIARTDHLDRYYVAHLNDRIAGLCMLRGWDEGFSVPSFGVFVGVEHQGNGLGRQMTEFAIEEARRLGCASLRLSVYESNDRARHLYEALGFKEVGRTSAFIDGLPETSIVMLKTL